MEKLLDAVVVYDKIWEEGPKEDVVTTEDAEPPKKGCC